MEADWKDYKKARNDTNIEIRNVKSEYYSGRIADQKSDPKKAWKTINSLLGRKTKSTTINELSLNGINMTDVDEIADGFNNYFFLDQILLGQLAPQITILKIILPGQMLNFPVLAQ